MITIETPRDPCVERAIAATQPRVSAADAADATTLVAFATRMPGRERPVKLIQHPSFRRTADLGPDPRFTLAGRAPHLLEHVARAA